MYIYVYTSIYIYISEWGSESRWKRIGETPRSQAPRSRSARCSTPQTRFFEFLKRVYLFRGGPIHPEAGLSVSRWACPS